MAEDDGKDEPQGRRRRSSTYEAYRAIPREDDLVRDLFNRADCDVTVPEQVQATADDLRYLRLRRLAMVKRRANRTRFLIWLCSGLGLAAIGVFATWIGQWAKAILP